MKLLFFALMMRDLSAENKGGFTPEEKTELQGALKGIQDAIETKNRTTIEEAFKKNLEPVNSAIKKFSDWQTQKDETDNANQKALDEVLTKMKGIQEAGNNKGREVKTLQNAMFDALQEKENQEKLDALARGQRVKIMLKGPIDLSAPFGEVYNPNAMHKMESKVVGNMTGANNLSGDSVISYSTRQAILPAQKTNARDLVPTVRSETGLYVHYRETTGEGSLSRQTEGSAKSQIDFDFTEVKTVNEYISGFARFSKQLRTNLPFLQGTLPRLLQREFFKVENRRFWDIVATAASGSSATGETNDELQLMDWITNQFEADFMASYAVMRFTALNRINKRLLSTGNYFGAGGVRSLPDGSVAINGVPVVPVTWIPSYDKALVFDRDLVERVEVESLAVEFFEQDSDNVQKNLITARIECFEEFNPMLPASIIVGDFGNSATS